MGLGVPHRVDGRRGSTPAGRQQPNIGANEKRRRARRRGDNRTPQRSGGWLAGDGRHAGGVKRVDVYERHRAVHDGPASARRRHPDGPQTVASDNGGVCCAFQHDHVDHAVDDHYDDAAANDHDDHWMRREPLSGPVRR
jgi:hypothetical protein